MELAIHATGGLALFLLAMQMMTEGLKTFAGSGLRQLLGHWTRTPLRGVGAGMLITGVVQSSSAVTVATIGFVNAGVLTLQQALGVIFGANVGTTMTGWLVSLVGFGIKIEALALPILTVGIILRLMTSDRRWAGLGGALAGFGLFFLALSLLKDAFGGLAESYGELVTAGGHWLTFIAVGFVATVLAQSSSAALAIILTAATGGVVAIEAAAAAVIGANLGTTSTAAIAALKATANARRLAVGHILFNAITGLIAILILPLLLMMVRLLSDWLKIEGSPAAVLALFHTLFNVLGVVILLPVTPRLTRLLEHLFRSEAEDSARPRFLDDTLTNTPALAVAALHSELQRMSQRVAGILQAALNRQGLTESALRPQLAAIDQLSQAITGFIAKVRTASMPPDLVATLTRDVRVNRYLGETAALSPSLLTLRTAADLPATVKVSLNQYLERFANLVALDVDATHFEDAYQALKTDLLTTIVSRQLSVERADQLLSALSRTRRMAEQWLKAQNAPARLRPAGDSVIGLIKTGMG